MSHQTALFFGKTTAAGEAALRAQYGDYLDDLRASIAFFHEEVRRNLEAGLRLVFVQNPNYDGVNNRCRGGQRWVRPTAGGATP